MINTGRRQAAPSEQPPAGEKGPHRAGVAKQAPARLHGLSMPHEVTDSDTHIRSVLGRNNGHPKCAWCACALHRAAPSSAGSSRTGADLLHLLWCISVRCAARLALPGLLPCAPAHADPARPAAPSALPAARKREGSDRARALLLVHLPPPPPPAGRCRCLPRSDGPLRHSAASRQP